MAKKKATRSAAASDRPARTGDDPKILQSVYQSGKFYNPGKGGKAGDEAALQALNLDETVLQGMTNRGLISGFGYEKQDAEEQAEEGSEEGSGE